MPDDPAATPPRRPADRYGDRLGGPRRGPRIALAVGAAAFLSWVVWAGLGAADRDVRWNDVGFTVRGPQEVEVVFDVIKDPGDSARCTLAALSAGYATVGIVTVDVGPGPARTVRSTAVVRTQELAVTGVVRECVLT